MDDENVRAQHFTTTVTDDVRGGARITVPFDPDEVWGTKPRHHVAGTIDGVRYRGVIERDGDDHLLRLGPAWIRDRPGVQGREVDVSLAPEGPQRDDLAGDIASALEANPDAAAFFDSLAQFYRRGYLRWIDATTRKPELRPQRIATMIDLLAAGVKDHRGHQSK